MVPALAARSPPARQRGKLPGVNQFLMPEAVHQMVVHHSH
jgi:hypothetical protein